jgi:hypothetical protein
LVKDVMLRDNNGALELKCPVQVLRPFAHLAAIPSISASSPGEGGYDRHQLDGLDGLGKMDLET